MSRIYSLLAVAFVACGFVSALAADPPKQAPKSSLDEELLKGLDNDLTRELDDLPSLKPQPTQSEKTEDGKTHKTKPTIVDGEDIGQLSEDQDPFNRIARRMKQVESRIARDQAGADTQQKQQQIMADLSDLIEKLNQQCQCQGGECKPGDKPQESERSKSGKGSKPGGSKSASNPARESSDKLRNEPATKPNANAEAIRQNMKDAWGNLPQRLREQMMQTSVDEFLPKYEQMIEQYFKRLAEEENTQRNQQPNPDGMR
jgi:hypothetical protein